MVVLLSVALNGGPCSLQAVTTMKNLYSLFRGVDATQVEINPLGMTKEGKGKPGNRLVRFLTVY
jgi:succinyl-CoA synthetase beta subunit